MFCRFSQLQELYTVQSPQMLQLTPIITTFGEVRFGAHILIQMTSFPFRQHPVLGDVIQCKCGKIFGCVLFNSVCTDFKQPLILTSIALLIHVLTFSLGYYKCISLSASDMPKIGIPELSFLIYIWTIGVISPEQFHSASPIVLSAILCSNLYHFTLSSSTLNNILNSDTPSLLPVSSQNFKLWFH